MRQLNSFSLREVILLRFTHSRFKKYQQISMLLLFRLKSCVHFKSIDIIIILQKRAIEKLD